MAIDVLFGSQCGGTLELDYIRKCDTKIRNYIWLTHLDALWIDS